MNRLSADCDCDGSPAEPDMHNIGILASYDPVALELTFEDYNQTEKISHPPKALTAEGMPNTFDHDAGNLCLYAPWGSLCIFYRDFRKSTSLIPPGHVDSGMGVIRSITENFTVTMEANK